MASITRGLPGLLPQEQTENAIQPEKEESPISIYLAGKRTLDARNRAVIWQRNAALGLNAALMALCLIMALENMRNSSKSHLVPYIVQTDQTGRIINTEVLKDRSVEEHFAATKTISAEVAYWIQDWRTVTTDIQAQRSLAERVFFMVADNSEAKDFLMTWFRSNNPMERAKQVHVEALVKSIVPLSANTYEVYWQESEINLASQTPVISNWRNKVELTVNLAASEAEIHRNRFGIFIKRITEPIKDSK